MPSYRTSVGQLGTLVRMSYEKIVLITSNDKDVASSNSNSDFQIYLKERYLTQSVSRIVVKTITLPNNFYSISDGTSSGLANNQFVFQQTGQAVQTVTLPQGQYNVNTLITALTTLINAALAGGTTVTITQDPITFQLTFTFAGGASNTVIIYSLNDPTNPNPMAWALGFYSTTAALAINTAPFPPALGGLSCVYLHSSILASSNAIDGGYGQVSTLETISMSGVPFGAYSTFQCNDHQLSIVEYSQPRNISSLHITLRDQSGVALNIGTGVLTLACKIYFDT